jgi:hypothetical protein
MTKTIIETRPNIFLKFRSEHEDYVSNLKIVNFLRVCVEQGIITNISETISEDELTKTRVFETNSPELLDTLRDFYFPKNQKAEQEWEEANQHTIIENPPYSPNLLEGDLEKFVEFLGIFENQE